MCEDLCLGFDLDSINQHIYFYANTMRLYC